MSTPLAVPPTQTRKKGTKKAIYGAGKSAIHATRVPKQFQVLFDLCKELTKEVKILRAENSALKSQNAVDKSDVPPSSSTPNPSSVLNSSSSTPTESFGETERKRSVVIAGKVESKDSLALNRVLHDHLCVKEISDFWNVDCSAISAYRLGRYNANHPRLIKVVLPASYYARLLLRRAHRLKYSKVSGHYVRPSLPKAKRDRQRAERAQPVAMSRARVVNDLCRNFPLPLPNITVESNATTHPSGTVCNGSEPLAMPN
ncbi:hypothetical protein ANCDUO_03611 [Ancylostoma duodenale]|uniref:Uncharacterized protein n=1 Tax=Ancylostoma duodenale TaxID=51022 RepID=A0A0C2H3F9_9BILA|nr:hypothetical protein ANCDUO_03611 [Ancylostoma duodenale]